MFKALQFYSAISFPVYYKHYSLTCTYTTIPFHCTENLVSLSCLLICVVFTSETLTSLLFNHIDLYHLLKIPCSHVSQRFCCFLCLGNCVPDFYMANTLIQVFIKKPFSQADICCPLSQSKLASLPWYYYCITPFCFFCSIFCCMKLSCVLFIAYLFSDSASLPAPLG